MFFYLRLDIQATMSYNPGMTKQTVTFSHEHYPELIDALAYARVKIECAFRKTLQERFDEYQAAYAKSTRLQRWFFGVEKYVDIDDYNRTCEDWCFRRGFHNRLINSITDMIDMLNTNPPPDAITIDYDFWVTISKNQTK
jgi:hypothetical protein